MEIMRNHARRDTGDGPHPRDGVAHRVLSELAVHITDMRREKRTRAARDADRVLELTAEGEHRVLRVHRHGEGTGHKAARAPHHPRCAIDNAYYTVIAARDDVPIVGDHEVGDVAKRVPRFQIIDCDRLSAPITTGHHQGRVHRLEQQMMKRCRWEHHTKRCRCRRHARRHRCICTPSEEHDRARLRYERGHLHIGHLAQRADHIDISHHDGEWLPRTLLSLSQAPHGAFVGGVAGQMEPAQRLERHDPASAYDRRRCCNRIARHTHIGCGMRVRRTGRPARPSRRQGHRP